jgi:glyoxalase family protein
VKSLHRFLQNQFLHEIMIYLLSEVTEMEKFMSKNIPGIHHVTAICDNAQQNVDFCVGLLGLRLVKQTVNFDMPDTYHLYYGDELGRPGTILTFFSWPDAPRGRKGTGEVGTVAFSIPENSLDYWLERLSSRNVLVVGPRTHFADQVLTVFTPDGLTLELVAHREAATYRGWQDGSVPPEHAIRGFHSVALMEADLERTSRMLTEMLGFELIGTEGDRSRYRIDNDGLATLVDVLHLPALTRGTIAVGSVHHVAWRTPSDEQQLVWREKLLSSGINVTKVMDRQYFHSIYFNEPGGALFEIATDPPGFAIDEPLEQLGTHLKLPPWLEAERPRIEQVLQPLLLPGEEQEE